MGLQGSFRGEGDFEWGFKGLERGFKGTRRKLEGGLKPSALKTGFKGA